MFSYRNQRKRLHCAFCFLWVLFPLIAFPSSSKKFQFSTSFGTEIFSGNFSPASKKALSSWQLICKVKEKKMCWITKDLLSYLAVFFFHHSMRDRPKCVYDVQKTSLSFLLFCEECSLGDRIEEGIAMATKGCKFSKVQSNAVRFRTKHLRHNLPAQKTSFSHASATYPRQSINVSGDVDKNTKYKLISVLWNYEIKQLSLFIVKTMLRRNETRNKRETI